MRLARSSALTLLVACGGGQAAISPQPPPHPTTSAPTPTVADAAAPVASPVPVEPGEPPAPPEVDLALSVPESAQLVAVAPDGAALLLAHGWTEAKVAGGTVRVTTAGGTVRTNTEYLAVLDKAHRCIEASVAWPALDRAAAEGSVAEALASLRAKDAADDVARLRTLAKRFGIRGVGPLAFGDGDVVVLEANNELYVAPDGKTFASIPGIGTSARLEPSPAGTYVAFAHCGSPCGGVYAPALLDLRTRKARDFRLGDAHDFHWTPDGKTLYFSFDDSQGLSKKASKVCVGRVDVDTMKASTVKCIASEVNSENISAAPPSANRIGVQVLGKDLAHSPFVVLGLPGGDEQLRVPADPIYPHMDDAGHLAWDDNDGPAFHNRVKVASVQGQETFDDARAVGLLAGGEVLVLPDDRPSHETKPLRTLRDQRCGIFTTKRLSK